MFKRFSAEDSIASHTQIKSSKQRNIRNDILKSYPKIEPVMELLFPKKGLMTVAKCHDHIQLVLYEGIPLFLNHRDGPFVPTLRVLHQVPDIMQHVRVDKGAIPYVLSGANVMCPGLTSKGADMPSSLAAGTPVAIMAEGKELPMAVGILTLSTEDIIAQNKGIAIQVLHHLCDDLWTLPQLQ